MAIVPGKWSPGKGSHQQMVKNLLDRARDFTPEHIAAGSGWYSLGQEDSDYIGGKAIGGLGSVFHGSAILSKLSPQTHWEQNRMQALQVQTLDDHQIHLLRKSVEDPSMREEFLTKGRIQGTPLGDAPGKRVLAAVQLHLGEQAPHAAFRKTNTGANKTHDFNQSLSSGGLHGLTIDTHAYDAAMNTYNYEEGSPAQAHLSSGGVYQALQRAYLSAHKKALQSGLIPEGTTPAQFQAMIWVHHLDNKVRVNNKARGRLIWQDRRNREWQQTMPELDPANHGLPAMQFRSDHFLAGASEGRGL